MKFKCDGCDPGCTLETPSNAAPPLYCPWFTSHDVDGADCDWKEVGE